MFVFDLQLFSDDDGLGDSPELDFDALGDDAPKLKALLRKFAADNKKVRAQAASRRVELDKITKERDDLLAKSAKADADLLAEKAKVTQAEEGRVKFENDFKSTRIESAIKEALAKSGAIDGDAVATVLKTHKDFAKILCEDKTFAIKGLDDVITAFKAEKPMLFGKAPVVRDETQRTRGTNANGLPNKPAGSQSGEQGTYSGRAFLDPNKSLKDLEREQNLKMFGRAELSQ